MNRLAGKCLLGLVPLLLTGLIAGATPADTTKVGVVLSGGGAKGYAHVGALRVIEEAGIHIDYIGGTSMGAIVGGLYAAGYTPDQMDSILQTTDIFAELTDQIEREDRSWFEKEYTEKYALSLFIRDLQLSIPTALSNGQSVFDLFAGWTMAVNDINDFSQLPVPFLAVGTDVVTGEQVLLEEGFLPLAMRASGALPGLLAPVRVGGRLLTDGGVVNNFPIEEVKAKGMDVVIGVTVEEGLYTEEELTSIFELLTQISTFQMVRRSKEQEQSADLVIRPSLTEYTMTSFDAVDSLVAGGERAARQQWEALRAIARQQQSERPARPPLPVTIDSLYIGEVIVRNNAAYSTDNILAAFPRRLRGNLSPEEFFEGIDALYATNRFNFVRYQFSDNQSDLRSLIIDPELRPGYDRQLRFGFHYDQIYNSSVLVNLTARNLFAANSVTVLDLIAGDNLRYNLHYLIERPRGPDWGLNSYLRYNDIEVDLTQPIRINPNLTLDKTDIDFLDWHAEVYARLFTNKNYSSGLAAGIKYFESDNSQVSGAVNAPILSNRSGFFFSGSLFYRYDSRDDRFFPTIGSDIEMQVRAIRPLSQSALADRDADISYNFDLQLTKMARLSADWSLGVGVNAGLLINDPVQPYFYLLGGYYQNFINNFRPFIGLGFADAVGTDLLMGQLWLRYRPFENHFITLSTQAAALDEGPEALIDQEPDYYGLGLSYGYYSPLGPIELTYGLSNEGSSVFFNLGYWF